MKKSIKILLVSAVFLVVGILSTGIYYYLQPVPCKEVGSKVEQAMGKEGCQLAASYLSNTPDDKGPGAFVIYDCGDLARGMVFSPAESVIGNKMLVESGWKQVYQCSENDKDYLVFTLSVKNEPPQTIGD